MNFLTINPVAFNAGGVSIHWYGLIIATGAFLGIVMAMREADRVGINSENILDMVLIAAPISLVGARLYYVIFEWGFYSSYPEEIVKVWHGGLAIYGGLITAFFVCYFFCKKRNLNFWTILDIAAPSVMLGQIIGRWGNFMNQEAYGKIISKKAIEGMHLPHFVVDQMFINGSYRQPTFLFESTWNLIGFIIIIYLRNRTHFFKQGEIFLTYVIWYSFGRFFVEGMRTDSLYLGPIRISQLVSLLFFIGAIIVFAYRRRNQKLPEYKRN